MTVLLFVPRLARAIACVIIVLIATPLLALLGDRRRSQQGPDMNDAYDPPYPENPENTHDEKTLLSIERTLDGAGAPRTEVERDGAGINLELSLPDRVRWLASEFSRYKIDLKKAGEEELRIHAMHDDTFRQLHAFLDTVEKERNWLKVSRDADHEDHRAQLAVVIQQRDEAQAQLMLALSRVAQFATTFDTIDAITRAEIVVHIPSGLVVKNRHGMWFKVPTSTPSKPRPKKPARAKAKSKKRKTR